MPPFILRPYQIEALEASKRQLDRGVTRQLISLPTGTGKTVIFSHLLQHHQILKRMLVLVHTQELVDQAKAKLQTYNNVSLGVEKGEQYARPSDRIVIGSVPTLGRKDSGRLGMFHPATFGAIVCDEAHHATADTYQRIFKHFGLFDSSNAILLLGMTATPYRRNGDRLKSVFEETVYELPMNEAIEQGWLCDLRAYRVRSRISLDEVGLQKGDFEQAQLSAAVNTSTRNELIVRSWYEHANGRSTVIFCVGIQHAHDLAAIFRRENVAAESIWGSDTERQDKINRHRKGQITVLTNCGVLTEGYDDPNISCIVLARPTMSQPLFVQMVGRGTRLESGLHNRVEALRTNAVLSKPDCVILDVTDNTIKHRLMTLPLAFGLDADIRLDGRSFCAVLRAAGELAMPGRSRVEAASSIEVESLYIDLFAPQWSCDEIFKWTSQWFRRSDGFVRNLPNDGFIKLSFSDKWTLTGRIEGQHLSPFSSTSFAEASAHGERMFRCQAADLIERVRLEQKSAHKATPTQLVMMRDLGLGSHHQGITREEAAVRIFRATEKELEAKGLQVPGHLNECEADPNVCVVSDPYVPRQNRCIAWETPLLRASSLKWFTTRDGGYACPLPAASQLSIYPVDSGWCFTRFGHLGEMEVLEFATQEEAARHAETTLIRQGTDLYAALHRELESSENEPTILQLELLSNLYGHLDSHMKLSRQEASVLIDEHYRFELMAGAGIAHTLPQSNEWDDD